MKHFLSAAFVFLSAGPICAQWGHRGFDLRCDIDLSLSQSVSVDISQEFGAERLECSTGRSGAVETVRVVRWIRATATAAARASASASGNSQASYRDHCAVSCDLKIPPHNPEPYHRDCSTSGHGSAPCLNSRAANSSDAKAMPSKVTVAETTAAGLAARSLKVTPSCEIVNSKGEILEPLTAVAMVTWIYGSELLKEAVHP